MSNHKGIGWQDIISFVYIRAQYWSSLILGTFLFFIKSMLFGVHCAGIVKCWGGIHILRAAKSEIKIGKNVTIVSNSQRCSSTSIFAPTKLRTWTNTSKIIIEDGAGLNGASICARSKTILIGKNTMIGPNVTIVDSDFHRVWPAENRGFDPGIEEDADVVIGKNVWIGTQAIILKGTRIGDNSVIGAGSVVRGEIPANVLAAGVPVKVIKKLEARQK